MDTQITGLRSKEAQENDQQSDVMQALRQAQTESIQNVNDFMRQSVRSLAASERQSVNESMIVDAVMQHMENMQR